MTGKNHKRGFNLIEAAIVLGVVGLVIGGIWIAAAAVNDQLKVSKAASGLVYACNRATNVFPRNLTPDSGGEIDILSSAIAANVFLSEWVNNGVVNSPISSNVLITQHTDDGWAVGIDDVQGMISVYLVEVPKKYCRRLLPAINTKTNTFISWVTVGVGGNDTHWDSVNSYILPYSGNISDGCDSETMKIEVGCTSK